MEKTRKSHKQLKPTKVLARFFESHRLRIRHLKATHDPAVKNLDYVPGAIVVKATLHEVHSLVHAAGAKPVRLLHRDRMFNRTKQPKMFDVDAPFGVIRFYEGDGKKATLVVIN